MVWSAGHFLKQKQYQIQEILGQGDFGVTYLAQYTPLNQPVVIKTPDETLKQDPNYAWFEKRFIQEAKLLAKVCQMPHPHIVQFRDFFSAADTPCLAMEFIPGKSLYRWVKHQKMLSEAEALMYIRHIGAALSTIHQAGVVHRDAHVANILLRPWQLSQVSGTVDVVFQAVLIDFGHAGEIHSHAMADATVLGNEYFAPYEQLHTKPGYQKPPVDVYSLAASLYFCLTGHYPAKSFERKMNGMPLVAPQEYNPNISAAVSQAIFAGMEVLASHRPQSVEEWLQLLPNGEF